MASTSKVEVRISISNIQNSGVTQTKGQNEANPVVQSSGQRPETPQTGTTTSVSSSASASSADNSAQANSSASVQVQLLYNKDQEKVVVKSASEPTTTQQKQLKVPVKSASEPTATQQKQLKGQKSPGQVDQSQKCQKGNDAKPERVSPQTKGKEQEKPSGLDKTGVALSDLPRYKVEDPGTTPQVYDPQFKNDASRPGTVWDDTKSPAQTQKTPNSNKIPVPMTSTGQPVESKGSTEPPKQQPDPSKFPTPNAAASSQPPPTNDSKLTKKNSSETPAVGSKLAKKNSSEPKPKNVPGFPKNRALGKSASNPESKRRSLEVLGTNSGQPADSKEGNLSQASPKEKLDRPKPPLQNSGQQSTEASPTSSKLPIKIPKGTNAKTPAQSESASSRSSNPNSKTTGFETPAESSSQSAGSTRSPKEQREKFPKGNAGSIQPASPTDSKLATETPSESLTFTESNSSPFTVPDSKRPKKPNIEPSKSDSQESIWTKISRNDAVETKGDKNAKKQLGNSKERPRVDAETNTAKRTERVSFDGADKKSPNPGKTSNGKNLADTARKKRCSHDNTHFLDECAGEAEVDEDAVRDFLDSNPIFLNSFVDEFVDRTTILNWIHCKSPPTDKGKKRRGSKGQGGDAVAKDKRKPKKRKSVEAGTETTEVASDVDERKKSKKRNDASETEETTASESVSESEIDNKKLSERKEKRKNSTEDPETPETTDINDIDSEKSKTKKRNSGSQAVDDDDNDEAEKTPSESDVNISNISKSSKNKRDDGTETPETTSATDINDKKDSQKKKRKRNSKTETAEQADADSKDRKKSRKKKHRETDDTDSDAEAETDADTDENEERDADNQNAYEDDNCECHPQPLPYFSACVGNVAIPVPCPRPPRRCAPPPPARPKKCKTHGRSKGHHRKKQERSPDEEVDKDEDGTPRRSKKQHRKEKERSDEDAEDNDDPRPKKKQRKEKERSDEDAEDDEDPPRRSKKHHHKEKQRNDEDTEDEDDKPRRSKKHHHKKKQRTDEDTEEDDDSRTSGAKSWSDSKSQATETTEAPHNCIPAQADRNWKRGKKKCPAGGAGARCSQPMMNDAEIESFKNLYGIDLRQVRL